MEEPVKITKQELYKLRQDLRNKTKLHTQAEDHQIIQELKRQIEELQRMVFTRRER